MKMMNCSALKINVEMMYYDALKINVENYLNTSKYNFHQLNLNILFYLKFFSRIIIKKKLINYTTQ